VTCVCEQVVQTCSVGRSVGLAGKVAMHVMGCIQQAMLMPHGC